MRTTRTAVCAPVLAALGLLVGSCLALSQETVSDAESPSDTDSPVEYQDLPFASQGDLRFFVDTAGFRGPKGYTRQEIFVLIDAKQLQFIPESGQYVAQMDLSVSLVDSTGQVVAEATWTRNVSIESPAALREANAPFRDVIGFDMNPGDYRMRLNIEDIYGDHQGSCSGVVRVRDLEVGRLSASDILFASELGESGQNGRFDRYSWKVVPNTTRSYLAGSPVRYYFEVYNVVADRDRPKDTFVLGCSLVDSSGAPIKRYPAKRVPKRGESVVMADSLDTEGIEGGAYYVQVEAFDRGTRQHFRARRGVHLIAPEGPVELTEDQKSQVRHYMAIKFVADQKDLKAYGSLESDETRMRFLRGFWRKLDPTPETPTNERLIEHMRRMRYGEDHFQGGYNQLGSETEKGRIYILYGPPDDIEYNTAASGGKPYELWMYERQGRYEFVFQDTRGIGVYEVVHTTYPGELPYNPDWQYTPTPTRGRRY